MSGHSGRADLRFAVLNHRMPFLSEQHWVRSQRIAQNIAIAVALIGSRAAYAQASAASSLNSGDTAWKLMASALVLLMTPGLALFYGGMVRRKNVLATLMYSHVALAIVTLQWVMFGYS